MSLLDAFSLAEVHREVYVAILDGWVPYGQRGDYARRAGITREYLSLLCQLDHAARVGEYQLRLPSPAVAQRLAAALPAPPEIRASLFDHMEAAHFQAHQGRRVIRQYLAERRVAAVLTELQGLHRQATFNSDPAQSERAYRSLRTAAADVAAQLLPARHPASYAQTCLYIHDAQCVLDRADDALYYAKLARLVLEVTDGEAGFARPQVNDLYINAVRGEAVAYHNLGLDRLVPALADEAEATPAYHDAGDFWQPLVSRDRLNALVNIPRFGLRAARRVAEASLAVCERTGDGFTRFLVQESWLRSLVQRGALKAAHRLLAETQDLLPRLPQAGPLHRALLYRTAANLARQAGDQAGWRQNVRDFAILTRQAGLKHQWRLFQQTYGAALDDVLAELVDAAPA